MIGIEAIADGNEILGQFSPLSLYGKSRVEVMEELPLLRSVKFNTCEPTREGQAHYF